MIETKTQFKGLAIGGKRIASADGKDAPVYNPATGEVIARVAQATAQDVDRAVKAAHGAFTAAKCFGPGRSCARSGTARRRAERFDGRGQCGGVGAGHAPVDAQNIVHWLDGDRRGRDEASRRWDQAGITGTGREVGQYRVC